MNSHHKKPQPDDDVELVAEESAESSFKPKKDATLKAELAEAKKLASEYLDGWQRAKADLINFRKEAEVERKKTALYAAEDLIAQCIPILDSFDMAFRNKDAWQQAPENWRRGVEYIHSQFLTMLRNNGVELLNPTGERFDPARHDSAETKNVDSKDDEGIIPDVIQKGYALNGKLIRAPKVIVGHYHA